MNLNTEIKNYVKQLMKKCDEDAELDFLALFGKFRNELVYEKKVITIDEFDDLINDILEDLGK